MKKIKPFIIPKLLFVQAYKLVKANAGAAGVDSQSLEDFELNLKDNLYPFYLKVRILPRHCERSEATQV